MKAVLINFYNNTITNYYYGGEKMDLFLSGE